jgi:hypothetical protein
VGRWTGGLFRIDNKAKLSSSVTAAGTELGKKWVNIAEIHYKYKSNILRAESSLRNQAAGSPTSGLVIDLVNNEGELGDRSVRPGPPSPIPQVDGEVKALQPDQVLYNFVSDYHKDDIKYTLDELFPAKMLN